MRPGDEHALRVGRVEVELPGRDVRHARPERRPRAAAVVGHVRPDVSPDVQRVRVRRVEDDRVHRQVGQVAADVQPLLPAVGRRKDVAWPLRRRLGLKPAYEM